MLCKWRQNTVRGSCVVFSLLAILGCASRLGEVGVLEATSGSSQTDSPMLIALSEAESTADGLQLVLSGTQPFSYKLANHDQPLHLTIDMPETRIEQAETRRIERDGIQTVRFHEAPGQPDTTRLEVYLDDTAVYSVGKEQEHLYVRVRPAENARPPSGKAQRVAALPSRSDSSSPAAVFGRPNTGEYRIGPGDVLDIKVYDEPDLSRKVRVSERGLVSIALIGSVPVQGLTLPQVTERLEGRLSPRYLLNPQVFVEVVEFASKKVFISGAVGRPMVFTMQGETTLMEVLSQVSGRDQYGYSALDISHSSALTVFRRSTRSDGNQQERKDSIQAFRINLDQLLRQGDMTHDIALQSHDVIYVPEPDAVFIFGEVGKTGPVPLSDGKMSLIEAINKAGGFGKFAATKRTRVLRMVDGKEQVIRVDMAAVIRGDLKQDITLKPNDIVIVPETVF